MAEIDVLGQIIQGCKAGEVESFNKLIDIYAKRCYGYFYRLCGSRHTCDDLLSELFVKLVAKIGTFRGGSFEAWLFKTASNVFHDYLRDKHQQRKLLEHRAKQLQSESTQPKRTEDPQIDNLQIQLAKLDADTRELITLRYYSQLSFKELAKMRAEPIGTSRPKEAATTNGAIIL
jgi:RNA polymerase sigma-70 factor (ECF subfamily)